MLLASNYKIVLTLFFIFNSLFFIVNVAGGVSVPAPVPASAPVPGTAPDTKKEDLSSIKAISEASQEPPKSKDQGSNSEDAKLPIAKLVKTGDDYVIISTNVLPKVEKVKCKVIFEYEIEIDGKWIQGKDLKDGITPEMISAKSKGNRIIVNWKVSPLKPNTNYKFYVFAKYGDKLYTEKQVALETTTKALPPKTTIVKRLSFLTFEDKNVKTYHVQINKVKENDKEADCIFEAKMSPCMAKDLTIDPDLTPGKKYTIKTWYTDFNDQQSKPEITQYIA